MGLAIYHSLLLYFGIYFVLKGGECCYIIYTIVIIFDGSLIHIPTEVPFETGKVVGLWYVGNTVYTVGMLHCILHNLDEGSFYKNHFFL